jgi:hypothetical protein
MSEPEDSYRQTGTLLYACLGAIACAAVAAYFWCTLIESPLFGAFAFFMFGAATTARLRAVAAELNKPRRPRDLPLPDRTQEDAP